MTSAIALKSAYGIGLVKARYAKKPIQTDREKLLRSRIVGCYLVTQELITNKNEGLNGYKKLILKGNITHAAIIAETPDNLHILIEFGIYDEHREGDYKTKVHYYKGKDGLRFVLINKEDIIELSNNMNNSVLHCSVKNEMTVDELLETNENGGFSKWDGDHYNLLIHNCQCFVRNAVTILGLQRDDPNSLASRIIPGIILKALERNERKSTTPTINPGYIKFLSV